MTCLYFKKTRVILQQSFSMHLFLININISINCIHINAQHFTYHLLLKNSYFNFNYLHKYT